MRQRVAIASMCAALVLTGGAVVAVKWATADRCLVRTKAAVAPGPTPSPQQASPSKGQVTADPDLPLTNGVGKAAISPPVSPEPGLATHDAYTGTPEVGPVVAFVPHQDDEALWMASDLSKEVQAGRQVVLVLVHNGNGTGARTTMAEKCGIDLGSRDSAQDAMIAARTAEFRASAAQMGVAPANVVVDDVSRADGRSTIASNKRLLRQWIMKFPHGSYRTMSWIDQMPDHAALGYALDELARAGEVDDARFYVKRGIVNGKECNGAACVLPPITKEPATERAVNALREYMVFDPAKGRYAVGRMSVSGFFEEALKDPQSYWHGSSAKWRSPAEEADSATQMRALQKAWWASIRRR